MSESPSMKLWGCFVQTKEGQIALMSKEYRIIAQAYHNWVMSPLDPPWETKPVTDTDPQPPSRTPGGYPSSSEGAPPPPAGA